jgi:AP2-like factor, ANT lineage
VEESPKMEDFLGGVGGAGGAPPATTAEDQQLVCGELGSIAAGFLRQYDPAPGTVENPGAVTVAMSTDAAESDQARRPVETFGQRTSIYRGVTR